MKFCNFFPACSKNFLGVRKNIFNGIKCKITILVVRVGVIWVRLIPIIILRRVRTKLFLRWFTAVLELKNRRVEFGQTHILRDVVLHANTKCSVYRIIGKKYDRFFIFYLLWVNDCRLLLAVQKLGELGLLGSHNLAFNKYFAEVEQIKVVLHIGYDHQINEYNHPWHNILLLARLIQVQGAIFERVIPNFTLDLKLEVVTYYSNRCRDAAANSNRIIIKAVSHKPSPMDFVHVMASFPLLNWIR